MEFCISFYKGECALSRKHWIIFVGLFLQDILFHLDGIFYNYIYQKTSTCCYCCCFLISVISVITVCNSGQITNYSFFIFIVLMYKVLFFSYIYNIGHHHYQTIMIKYIFHKLYKIINKWTFLLFCYI